MKVLVTGGAGFIGSHVAEELAAAGHQVRLFDSLDPTVHPVAPAYIADFELIRGDIRDPDVVHSALSGVDAVVHQAAVVGLGVDIGDMPRYVSTNDLGTAVLLSQMAQRDIGWIVLASSMVVYGEGRYACATHGVVSPAPRSPADLEAGLFEPRCPHCAAALSPGLVEEDAPVDPRNTYAASKVAQEHLVASWTRVTGGAGIALRYHNVYGPRMPRDTPYSGVAAIFRSTLARGEPPRVFEDGAQRRDFVHVRDVARANLAALEAVVARERSFTAYNIASGEPHTVGEMATALAKAYGGPPPVVTGEYRLGDVRHVVASPERARRELGFVAQVSFAEGMREFATAPLRG